MVFENPESDQIVMGKMKRAIVVALILAVVAVMAVRGCPRIGGRHIKNVEITR